ncbi:MAG: hypothetical protein HOO99_11010 [Hyphomicrobiaceae bacterium]|nr:hypothetical protein [Hyphomicrobiaceae bacterium]
MTQAKTIMTQLELVAVVFRLTSSERALLTEYRRALPDLPGEGPALRKMLAAAKPFKAGVTPQVETKGEATTAQIIVRMSSTEKERINELRRVEPDLPNVSEYMRRLIVRTTTTRQK